MNERDILELGAKSLVENAPSSISPNLWEDLGLSPDLWPSFGWNVPDPRSADSIGLALAVQCAAVKARDIAKAGMQLWRRKDRRWTAVEADEHWFAKLLAGRPNPSHSWSEFWRMTVMHLELAQNAYLLKDINRRGEVISLWPIQPARVRQRVSDAGRVFYEIQANTQFERAQLRADIVIVPAERIIHFRGKMLDGAYGLSSTELGNPILKLFSKITEYQTTLFGGDGKTPLVFETDQAFMGEMADAAFKRLKQQLAERVRKAGASGEPILLEAGLKAKSIAMSSRDAMTSDAYKQIIERICGLMECPPHKIFHFGDGAKYDNVSAADNMYSADCLVPMADLMEEKLRLELLPEDEWPTLWPEFEREAMTASDPKTMTERVKTGIMTGVMTINEARERFGLNPLEGDAGDRFLVPVNMSLMGMDGEMIAQAAASQTGGNEPTGDESNSGDDGIRLAVDNT